jgi:outer membrane protein OmpA-like peptidoglycan-associated protein
MRRKALARILVLGVALFPTAAAAESHESDVEGSKDHPAVKRYPGSFVYEFVEREFEAVDLPAGASRCEHVEGKYFAAWYQLPEKVSCTQVMRNYDNAFKASKLTTYGGKAAPEACTDMPGLGGAALESWETAVGKGPKGGKTWIHIGCSLPWVLTVVVDVAEMEQKVEIDADYLAGEIEKSGHVAVYGINFATGKADISADSARVLAEIGNLLARKPDWRLRIEGHTDNVGNAKANQELSDKRAQAVKAWLGAKHGVKPERLETQGFGDTKPVADNKTDEGRGKNRRVELVKL